MNAAALAQRLRAGAVPALNQAERPERWRESQTVPGKTGRSRGRNASWNGGNGWNGYFGRGRKERRRIEAETIRPLRHRRTLATAAPLALIYGPAMRPQAMRRMTPTSE